MTKIYYSFISIIYITLDTVRVFGSPKLNPGLHIPPSNQSTLPPSTLYKVGSNLNETLLSVNKLNN